MKRIIPFLLLGLVLTGCSHRIVRTGYQMEGADSGTCDVVIKKNFSVSDAVATKIGEIKLGESGFSTACSEEHAVEIFRKEACALNADLISVTEEKRPDLWSSCYRGRAQFYKYKVREETESIAGDDAYKPENVKERVFRDKRRSMLVRAGCAAAGFLVGFLLVG